jgi:hypothetical protein
MSLSVKSCHKVSKNIGGSILVKWWQCSQRKIVLALRTVTGGTIPEGTIIIMPYYYSSSI